MTVSTFLAILTLALAMLYADAVTQTRTAALPIDQVQLRVEYTWSAPNTDLDTNTVFLDESVGHACPGRPRFLLFDGDVRTTGGTERATVNIAEAAKAGRVPGNAIVDLRAHWFSRTGEDATIRVSVLSTASSRSLTSLSIPITPADNERGCATEFVGRITVFPRGRSVEITLSNDDGGTPPTENPRFIVAGCRGDPHCSTFDTLKYDCQGTGEFILVKSPTIPGLEVQARFGDRVNGRVTLTEGIAMSFPGAPKAQMSIAKSTTTTSTTVASCPIAFFVNGVARRLTDGTGSTLVTLTNSGSRYTLTYTIPGIVAPLSMTVQPRMFGGRCYLEGMNLQISAALLGNQFIGLLGSPDGDPFNDWMTMDGTTLPTPQTPNDRLFETAYRYCVDNWCNRDASKSLFTYESDTSHATFDKCNLPFPGRVNLAAAPREVRDLCLRDEACLVEGLVGGTAAARSFVAVERRIARLAETVSPLSFEPSSIALLSPSMITVKLDVRDRPTSQLAGVTSFALFTINAQNGRIFSFLGELFDDGREIHSDDSANDRIFTSKFTLFSFTRGESFSFKAIPVVDGERMERSPLVQTRLNAVVANAAGGFV